MQAASSRRRCSRPAAEPGLVRPSCAVCRRRTAGFRLVPRARARPRSPLDGVGDAAGLLLPPVSSRRAREPVPPLAREPAAGRRRQLTGYGSKRLCGHRRSGVSRPGCACSRRQSRCPLALDILAALGAGRRSAAILTIGNELLSGDVENTNGSWLARRLEAIGVPVRLIAVLPDDIAGDRRVRPHEQRERATRCSSPAASAAPPTTSRARRSRPRSASSRRR